MFISAAQWDPALIVAQIASVQCLYYAAFGAAAYLCVGARAELGARGAPSVRVLFAADALTDLGGGVGLRIAFCYALSALAGAAALALVVERAKKCLDFAATLHLVHVLACTFYAGLPRRLEWWAVLGGSLAIMAMGGEWLCIRREMRDIPLGGGGAGRGRGATVPTGEGRGGGAGSSGSSRGGAASGARGGDTSHGEASRRDSRRGLLKFLGANGSSAPV